MKKLQVADLHDLSENDQGLLFNYVGAKSGVAKRQRHAFAFALMGCITIGMAYVIDSSFPESANLPDWFSTVQWLAKVLPSAAFSMFVILQLVLARVGLREVEGYESQLAGKGLDASGLTEDQVFVHVAMPMFRRAGVRIKE